MESEKRQKASAYLGRSRHQLSVCTRHPGRRVSQSRGRPPQKQPTVTDEASQGAAAPESHMARATRDRHRLAFTFRRPLRDAAPWRAVQRCAVPCCLAAAAGCAAMDATMESSARSEELQGAVLCRRARRLEGGRDKGWRSSSSRSLPIHSQQ